MNKIRFASFILLCFLMTGCNRGPKMGIVTGVVTVDGKPVNQGTIMFIPEGGKAAVGSIDADGHYSLTTFVTDDGVMVGDHRVTILSTLVGSGSFAPASIEDEIAQANNKSSHKLLVPGRVDWIVPERFSQLATTELTATVKAGKQTINFNLSNK